jgi:hypothetical protein
MEDINRTSTKRCLLGSDTMYFGIILQKIIKKSAKRFSEEINFSPKDGKLVNFFQTTRCYNPKDCHKN